MKTMIAIATASLIAAVPAVAEPLAPRPVSEAATQEAAPAPAARGTEQRICLVDTVTGSHIPRRECNTRAQWKRLNVDLPATL